MACTISPQCACGTTGGYSTVFGTGKADSLGTVDCRACMDWDCSKTSTMCLIGL